MTPFSSIQLLYFTYLFLLVALPGLSLHSTKPPMAIVDLYVNHFKNSIIHINNCLIFHDLQCEHFFPLGVKVLVHSVSHQSVIVQLNYTKWVTFTCREQEKREKSNW